MTTYNISVNDDLAIIVEEAIKAQKYANRSEFFRDLVRKFYVNNNQYEVDELGDNDEDYKLLQKRERQASFVKLTDII